jgi:hypothetical protein
MAMAPPAKPTTAQGWREGVHFSMLPGVASEPELVHHTRVDTIEQLTRFSSFIYTIQ